MQVGLLFFFFKIIVGFAVLMGEILDGLEVKFGLLPASVLTVNSYMVAHLGGLESLFLVLALEVMLLEEVKKTLK